MEQSFLCRGSPPDIARARAMAGWLTGVFSPHSLVVVIKSTQGVGDGEGVGVAVVAGVRPGIIRGAFGVFAWGRSFVTFKAAMTLKGTTTKRKTSVASLIFCSHESSKRSFLIDLVFGESPSLTSRDSGGGSMGGRGFIGIGSSIPSTIEGARKPVKSSRYSLKEHTKYNLSIWVLIFGW